MTARGERVRAWVRRIASLEQGDAQVGAAARELADIEPHEAVHAIAELLVLAPSDEAVARTLGAVERAVAYGRDADLPAEARSRIEAAAREFALDEVSALFARCRPARTLGEGESPRGAPALAELTLGYRRQLARSADPEKLACFAAESEPSIVRNVLLNPRLTEDLVVRIAARRPARAEALREIWLSRRWSNRRRVRVALARNPYAEPEVAVQALVHLSAAELGEVADDGTLHGLVRETARRILDRRQEVAGEPDEPS